MNLSCFEVLFLTLLNEYLKANTTLHYTRLQEGDERRKQTYERRLLESFCLWRYAQLCLLTASMRTLWAFKTRTILYLYISERGEPDSSIDGVTRIDTIPVWHFPSCWTRTDEKRFGSCENRCEMLTFYQTNKLWSKQKQANEQICQETFIRSIKMERTKNEPSLC